MRTILLFLLILFLNAAAIAQKSQPRFFSLEPADTLHKGRFRTAALGGGATYGAVMFGLYNAWYKDYPISKFHTFNDMGEWNQMDKMGHWLMSYQEARWVAMAARWTGMPRKKAAWVGFAGGQLFQTSFEIFDGFSDQWGFSLGDVGFNTLGSGLFVAQELGWKEQRISMKLSGYPVKYDQKTLVGSDGSTTTLEQRARELYGTGPINIFLKNYNTLVVWSSVNVRSFMPEDRATWIPKWLNVAGGMGADNLFAGFGYEWQQDKTNANSPIFRVDEVQYPRTRQFFLSLDVDLNRIKVKNRFLRTLLQTANIFKIPAPTLMYDTQGRFRFYPVYF